jgi:hypothetical protein
VQGANTPLSAAAAQPYVLYNAGGPGGDDVSSGNLLRAGLDCHSVWALDLISTRLIMPAQTAPKQGFFL